MGRPKKAVEQKSGEVFVYSTLTCPQEFCVWRVTEGDMREKVKSVVILGGSGLADDRGDTHVGILTRLTEDEYRVCEQDNNFQHHVKNGFITVIREKLEPEQVTFGMALADGSAPITPSSLGDGAEFDVKEHDLAES